MNICPSNQLKWSSNNSKLSSVKPENGMLAEESKHNYSNITEAPGRQTPSLAKRQSLVLLDL